jgi:hypothetical protein
VPLMVGVGNGFEEIFVSPGATHVFGRAGSFTLQAERIPATRLGPQAALEQDLVPPGIPQVVLVLEPEPPPAPGVDRHDTTGQEPTPIEHVPPVGRTKLPLVGPAATTQPAGNRLPLGPLQDLRRPLGSGRDHLRRLALRLREVPHAPDDAHPHLVGQLEVIQAGLATDQGDAPALQRPQFVQHGRALHDAPHALGLAAPGGRSPVASSPASPGVAGAPDWRTGARGTLSRGEHVGGRSSPCAWRSWRCWCWSGLGLGDARTSAKRRGALTGRSGALVAHSGRPSAPRAAASKGCELASWRTWRTLRSRTHT